MKTLLKNLFFAGLLGVAGFAQADQIHIEGLGVGVAVNSVVEQPTWALVKEEGAVALYTAWVGNAAAVVAIEKDPDTNRILRFSVKVPGGGEMASETFQALRASWGELHEKGLPVKIDRVISCQGSAHQTVSHKVSVGGLYEEVLTPSGSSPQGVLLSTKQPPKLGPTLTGWMAQIDDGSLAGADPNWNSAYLLQKNMGVDAAKAAPQCLPNKAFAPIKEFTLGKPIDQQANFVTDGGQWTYKGFYVAYELPFADADAFVDGAGRLNDIRFVHNNVTLFDFNTMLDNAKMEMGPSTSMEQHITEAGNQTTHLWKTAAGSVEMSLFVPAKETMMGQLTLRYYLRGEE